MSRWTQSGPNDEVVSQEGDRAFVGVDMRRDATLLEPGLCSLAINKVFSQGIAQARPGMRTKRWARELGVNFPLTFNVDFSIEQGFGKVWGAGVFSDPYGQEFAIIACSNVAYRISPGCPVGTIKYPSGVVISGAVTFTQAFNVALMWRGEDLDPLKFETGTDFSTEFEFEAVPQETTLDYTSTIPRAARGLAYGNRVWVGYDKSRVAFSDLLAYTRWDASQSEIYLNAGADDALQVLVAFGENGILAFKDRSIYVISGVLPSPGTTGRIDIVSTERGCVAPESVVQVGKDVWFLSGDGIYSISQALDNKLQAGTDAISGPIQPLIDRINWGCVAKSRAMVHENRYYLAVPLDGADYCNAILVYDFLNRAWAGYWTGEYLDVAEFLRMDVGGRRRLLAVCGDSLVRRQLLQRTVLPARFPIDWTLGQFFSHTLSYNTTFAFSNVIVGNTLYLSVKGASGYGINWPFGVTWVSGSQPANPAAGETKYYSFVATSGSTFTGAELSGFPDLYIDSPVNFGAVLMLDEGFTDELHADEAEVNDLLRTRAYTLGTVSPKRWMGAALEMDTWHGQADFFVVRDGVNERRTLGTVTKDRTKSYLWNAPAYDPANLNGQHGAAGREDYSMILDRAQDWSDGVAPGTHQRATENFRLRESTRAMQLEIVGTRGRNNLSSVVVSAAADREDFKTKI